MPLGQQTTGGSSIDQFEDFCTSPSVDEDFLVQESIEPLLLVHGSRFHIRSYLLIVSTDPFIALFRNGFALRSFHPYLPYIPGRPKVNPRKKSLPLAQYITHTKFQEMHPRYSYADHWWTYDRIQKYFESEESLGSEKFSNLLDNVKRMTLTVSDTLRPRHPAKKGMYYFLSVDMMVKSDLTLRLLEANTSPLLAVQPYMWNARVKEDFKIMNEILHIIYTYYTESRKDGQFDPTSLILSPDWDLLDDEYSVPSRRYAPLVSCYPDSPTRVEL